MIFKKMHKILILSFLTILLLNFKLNADENFNKWIINFKIKAINSGISEKIVNDVMSNARFLPKVIEYDRFQPEFYEDTFTYIKKRSSKSKVKIKTI